jgi:hypothetical protein
MDATHTRVTHGNGPVRSLAAIATLASLALLAVVLAWWGWRLFGPPAVHVTAAAPADPIATIRASGLFAAPATVAPPAPGREEGPQSLGDARLLGIVAEQDGRGYALFRLPTGTRIVRSGQEIAQGAQLVSVRIDGVTIRDGSGERRILLRAEPANALPAPTTSTAPTPVIARTPARSSACTPPAGFKGPVLRLNAELFQGIIAKPESWTALVAPEAGGLSVRDDSGFITMLAMKKGDRLEQANGIALTAPDDVVGAVLKPLAANQAVRVSGKRDGAPREWLLLNAGTCPG